tara:strand:- start:421614 stop:422411 length:798 start_codon:yes stop_codon:yes gene_type:complete
MKIFKPEILHEIGGRTNNEDAVFPKDPTSSDNLFLVCDGVGGQEKGEVASQLICTYFPKYFLNKTININDKHFLEFGLQFVEQQMKKKVAQLGDNAKMASTLTLLYLAKNNALIGWVGDSRVYHIRNGNILFQTKDHSEVQGLVDMGEITEAEAENHPRKNIITRAVSPKAPTRIDQTVITDIRPNDFFLLCTDGILENLNKEKIAEWFVEEKSANEVKSTILTNALNNTKDNFSMALIKIDGIENSNDSDTIKSIKKRFLNLFK